MVHPVKSILGAVAKERGGRNEAHVLAACQLESRPSWMVSSHAATPKEDRAGIDIVVESDVGKLFVQVKSSKGGKAAFLERRRPAAVGIVVVGSGDQPEKLLAKVVGALAPIRCADLDACSAELKDEGLEALQHGQRLAPIVQAAADSGDALAEAALLEEQGPVQGAPRDGIRAGTEFCFVDWPGGEGAIAEVRVPDERYVGGARFDTITVGPEDVAGLAKICDECFLAIGPVEEISVGTLAPEQWSCDKCLKLFSLRKSRPHPVAAPNLWRAKGCP